jgi:hypothetical protein
MFGSEYFFLVFDYIPGFRFLLCIFAFLVKYVGQVAPLGSSSLGDLTTSREGSAD